MKAIIKRNCKIYFNNKTNLFFSLLGALIVFFLYILFIRKNTISQVSDLTNGALLIDMWLLGGVLSVTALTTSFSVLGQLIEDKSENKFMDFSITDVKAFPLLVGYFFSAVFISIIMQIVIFAICLGYFNLQEKLILSPTIVSKVFGMMILTALTATSFNLVICSFVKKTTTLNTIGNMFGALSGFLCTAYIPVGNFSGIALTVIKVFPMSYASSGFRRVLMMPILQDFPSAQQETLMANLGVGYKWHDQLSSFNFEIVFLCLTILICLVIIGLMSKKIQQVTLA